MANMKNLLKTVRDRLSNAKLIPSLCQLLRIKFSLTILPSEIRWPLRSNRNKKSKSSRTFSKIQGNVGKANLGWMRESK